MTDHDPFWPSRSRLQRARQEAGRARGNHRLQGRMARDLCDDVCLEFFSFRHIFLDELGGSYCRLDRWMEAEPVRTRSLTKTDLLHHRPDSLDVGSGSLLDSIPRIGHRDIKALGQAAHGPTRADDPTPYEADSLDIIRCIHHRFRAPLGRSRYSPPAAASNSRKEPRVGRRLRASNERGHSRHLQLLRFVGRYYDSRRINLGRRQLRRGIGEQHDVESTSDQRRQT